MRDDTLFRCLSTILFWSSYGITDPAQSNAISYADQESFRELLDMVTMDLCTGIKSPALRTAEERRKAKEAAWAQCKEMHALLMASPFWQQGECIGATDPGCAPVKGSCLTCRTRFRCSVTVDGLYSRYSKISIHKCVKSALALHREERSTLAQEYRKSKYDPSGKSGWVRRVGAPPPSPPSPPSPPQPLAPAPSNQSNPGSYRSAPRPAQPLPGIAATSHSNPNSQRRAPRPANPPPATAPRGQSKPDAQRPMPAPRPVGPPLGIAPTGLSNPPSHRSAPRPVQPPQETSSNRSKPRTKPPVEPTAGGAPWNTVPPPKRPSAGRHVRPPTPPLRPPVGGGGGPPMAGGGGPPMGPGGGPPMGLGGGPPIRGGGGPPLGVGGGMPFPSSSRPPFDDGASTSRAPPPTHREKKSSGVTFVIDPRGSAGRVTIVDHTQKGKAVADGSLKSSLKKTSDRRKPGELRIKD